MFGLEISGIEIVARTALIYAALLFGLRLAGKREIGQMTPFDLTVILLIANAVQNSMVGPDSSVTGGLIAASVLIGANYIVARLSDRIEWLKHALEGTPTLLVSNGTYLKRNMRRENVGEEEVMMAVRQHGTEKIADVTAAILEVDGSISVVLKDQNGAAVKPRKQRRFLKKA
jgi:uncharacterized membrane protein YcaP (DUF421 family)